MRQIIIISSLLGLGLLNASTPLNFSMSYHGGYDSNVMRFSEMEIDNASNDRAAMGGSNSFDSYINKINTMLDKTIYEFGNKELRVSSSYNYSNYIHNSNKSYWSGNIITSYKWGAYRNIKYTLRHLNSYYLRHYIDRDISTTSLRPCYFSDQDQLLAITLPIKKRIWYSIGFGYLQRYYDNPFTEFDLDIFYSRIKLNRRIKKFGTISLQIDRISAENILYKETAVSSNFDRSYEGLEWYLPIKMNKNLTYFSQLGMSMRQEMRVYEAEALDDALHSGRDHKDLKIDFWASKKIKDDILITISTRFRKRDTNSSYEWVSDLKSFKQMQIWCKIKWSFTYDNY